MECPGHCQCGKSCVLDHEAVERRCACNGAHNICGQPCKHGEACAYIARHRGEHGCLTCFKETFK